ncbi:MAG TPA: hypothetical protein VGO22_15515 [Pseudorhizobium sp.]|jgi:hypothetical protein|nr:hypothetical protein [Pseudorhizobium sp.]
MPLYFFDIQDPEKFDQDDIGIECETPETVREAAIEALPGLAKDLKLGVQHHWIAVIARDETGKSLFRASLTLDAGWLD